MLYEALVLLKYMPKVSVFYLLFALLNGMAISYALLAVTGFFDIVDYTV